MIGYQYVHLCEYASEVLYCIGYCCFDCPVAMCCCCRTVLISSITVASSIVGGILISVCPSTIDRKTFRNILPERVFGKRLMTTTFLKQAKGPTRWRTLATISLSNFKISTLPLVDFNTTIPRGTWPRRESGIATTALSATRGWSWRTSERKVKKSINRHDQGRK